MVNFDPYLVYTIQILKNRQGWAPFFSYCLLFESWHSRTKNEHWTDGILIEQKIEEICVTTLTKKRIIDWIWHLIPQADTQHHASAPFVVSEIFH